MLGSTSLASRVERAIWTGTGSVASFDGPSGVAVDGAGNVFVADAGNHTILKVTAAGVVTTMAATPVARGPWTARVARRFLPGYGQTLGTSVLTGGAASVPGRFAFTSPGTVPAYLGTANQSATFTPDDAADYGTALLTGRVTVVAPLPFWLWTAVNGFTGTPEVAFMAPNAKRCLPNGLAYAFSRTCFPASNARSCIASMACR